MMSYFVGLSTFCFITLCCTTRPTVAEVSSASTKDNLQTLVEKFINKVKDVLKGNDPYSFGSAGHYSNSYGTLINASVSDLTISGIGTMNMTYLSVVENDPNIEAALNLTFNNFILTGNYFLDLDPLTLVKIYGSGPFGTTAPTLNLNITTNLTQNINAGDALQITDLIITLGVPNAITFDIKNLLDRPALSEFATKIINDIGPSVLNDDEQVQNLLSAYAKSSANSYMINHQITLDFVKEFMEKFIQ